MRCIVGLVVMLRSDSQPWLASIIISSLSLSLSLSLQPLLGAQPATCR